jgi:hypothetical protein
VHIKFGDHRFAQGCRRPLTSALRGTSSLLLFQCSSSPWHPGVSKPSRRRCPHCRCHSFKWFAWQLLSRATVIRALLPSASLSLLCCTRSVSRALCDAAMSELICFAELRALDPESGQSMRTRCNGSPFTKASPTKCICVSRLAGGCSRAAVRPRQGTAGCGH